jgi:hypothetical protein
MLFSFLFSDNSVIQELDEMEVGVLIKFNCEKRRKTKARKMKQFKVLLSWCTKT